MAITAAVAAALVVPTQSAHALSLGRITVQSALGEPLRAEIELPDISAEEAASLQPSIAAPEAFRAAGLDYSAALQDIRISQERRPNGSTVLRLSSDRAVSEPFVDLILQVSWASGRVVRDYTILLDPPRQRQAASAPATAAQVAPSASAPTAPAASAAPTPAQAAASAASPPPPPAVAARSSAAASAGASGELTVRPGDTAGRLAAANKAPNISLDQMLVAMLRSNPEAFVQGNVNRLRAGAVLDLPTPEQAASVPAPEASRLITAQSRDFNAFRGRLAGNVPSVRTDGADRSASGRVQTQVDEGRARAGAPDRLTLSKGGLQARATEERIAREKAEKESTERVAELSRNITELNQLGAASTPAPAAPAASAASSATTDAAAAPGAASSAPVTAPTVSPLPSAAPASAPEAAAETAAPTQRLNGLLGNPLVLAAAAALVALLAAFGIYRARQRRKAAAADAAGAVGSPDSFFSSSGGQHIDTADVAGPMTAVPSQLDAASDADPVAEADVYLAYGRDLQAEEILKEALRTQPTRVAIHAKLAEIYAKRRDTAAFLPLAAQAHALTDGAGSDWAHIAELGRDLAPGDPMWDQGAGAGSPTGPVAGGALAAGAAATVAAAADKSAPSALESGWPDEDPGTADAPPLPPAPAIDFDLDLDLDTDQPSAPARSAADLDDKELDELLAEIDAMPPPSPPPLADDLDFDLELDPGTPPAAHAAAGPTATDPAPAAPGFDLGSLSLDLGDATADAPAAPAAEPGLDDPLATKLALAEEFNAIGDADGARALAEEVLAEASGPLRAQAERFLAELG